MMLLNSYDCNFCKIKPLPGSGRSPGGGNGNPLQYSCLGHPMDRETWQATAYGVTQSRTQLKQLSMHMDMPLENLLCSEDLKIKFSLNITDIDP